MTFYGAEKVTCKFAAIILEMCVVLGKQCLFKPNKFRLELAIIVVSIASSLRY